MRPVHACAFTVLTAVTGCSLVFGDDLAELKKPRPGAGPGGDGVATDGGGPDGAARSDGAADVDGSVGAVCDGGPCGEPLVPVAKPLNDLKVTPALLVWSTADGVYACDRASCAATERKLAAGSPTSLVIEDGVVYWANAAGTTLESCAVTGCNLAPSVVRTGLSLPAGPASDGTSLYFTSAATTGSGATIYRCPRATCATATPEPFRVHPSKIGALAANAQNVLWVGLDGTDYWGVYAKSTEMDGKLVTSSVDPTFVPPVITAKDAFYVQRSHSLFARDADEPLYEALTGGVGRTLATGIEPRRLAASDAVVAWTDAKDHAIYRCPVAKCDPSPTVVMKSSSFDATSAIAVEGSAFVYASAFGMLVRFAL